MYIPDLHLGDTIKYYNHGHIYKGIIQVIDDEYFFRSGIVEKAYMVTHLNGWGRLPVRQCEILVLDKKSITAV